MTGILIGYARAGGVGAQLDEQHILLADVGCDPIFLETDDVRARALANRARGQALRSLGAGNTLVVTSLDRLGHSLVDIAAVLQRVFDSGADLRVLDDNLDTRNGEAVRPTLLALAKAQSALVRERARDGLAVRRAEGKRVGPPVRLKPEQWPEFQAMLARKASAAEMAAHFKVSRPTLWNFRRRMEAADEAQLSGSSAKS